MNPQGLNQFVEEVESHCTSTAILTFMGSQGNHFVIDLQRQVNGVIYDYHEGGKQRFMAKILAGCKPSGSVVLRSFTPEIDQLTHLPIKELRGYVLQFENNKFLFQKLSADMMFACQNTDANTGEPLSLEQSVRYC